jgi:hypothetical protein
MINKSVISLISYDAKYLANSIKRYYDYVDDIVLGLDKDRVTWSGNNFSFNEAELWSELSAIDGDNKISIIEDNFHTSSVAIDNDNFERNFLKHQCKHDCIISIDADEYLLNAKEFFYNYLPIVERYLPKVDICMNWATPYKKIDEDTILVIANEDGTPFLGENQGFVTSKTNTFTYARWTNISAYGENRLISPLIALHWSLCRDKDDLGTKINNIGHSDLVEKDPFYSIWKNVNLDNYEQLKNFKTSNLGGAQWPKLVAMSIKDLETYYLSAVGSIY